eukprot:m.41892 g.41892  ORF g.41892 m.41892 type:complete len:51 (-) comp14315_c0_seq1:89-241(-)
MAAADDGYVEVIANLGAGKIDLDGAYPGGCAVHHRLPSRMCVCVWCTLVR